MSENNNMNPKAEKMFYSQWWFWAIMAGLILGLVLLLGPNRGAKEEAITTTTGTSSVITTTASPKEVILLDSAYSMSENNDYIYWAAEFQNPDGNSTAYEFTKILVTAYDGNGTVLATSEQTMNLIQPGEKQAAGSVMDSHGQVPAKVDFAIESGTPETPSQEALKSSDFQIEGTTERVGEFGNVTYTGTVRNNGTSDASDVGVAVILKQDGKLVYVESSYVENLAAGQQKAFEIDTLSKVPAHNSYEVIAYDWGF